MFAQDRPKSHGMTTVKDYATITIQQPYVVVLCYYTPSTHGYQKKKTGGIRALCIPKASFCTRTFFTIFPRVSVQGVESLWGDCRFMVYFGRLVVIVVDLCYFALFEDFSL